MPGGLDEVTGAELLAGAALEELAVVDGVLVIVRVGAGAADAEAPVADGVVLAEGVLPGDVLVEVPPQPANPSAASPVTNALLAGLIRCRRGAW